VIEEIFLFVLVVGLPLWAAHMGYKEGYEFGYEEGWADRFDEDLYGEPYGTRKKNA
jgi:hypothetical protein